MMKVSHPKLLTVDLKEGEALVSLNPRFARNYIPQNFFISAKINVMAFPDGLASF